MNFNENGKVALVTGASKGLGKELAKKLLSEGWIVILTGRGKEALAEARKDLDNNARAILIAGDVSMPCHRQEVAETVKQFGHIDLIVNNAGALGTTPLPELLNYPMSEMEEVYRVNVFAPLALIQTLSPFLKKGSKIINVSSDAAANAYKGWGGYGSSKAALDHLTKVLMEERPELYIYAADPGDMRTQMHQAAFPGEDISDRPLPEASVPGFYHLINNEVPSGRYVTRELV